MRTEGSAFRESVDEAPEDLGLRIIPHDYLPRGSHVVPVWF